MSKIRINDLARELEVKSKAILDVLTAVGVTEKKTHSSSLEEHEAEKVRAHFRSSAESTSSRPARSSRADADTIKTKIDLSHITKPGDVLKLISKQQAAPVATPPRPAPPAPPPIEKKTAPVAPSAPPVKSAPPVAPPAPRLIVPQPRPPAPVVPPPAPPAPVIAPPAPVIAPPAPVVMVPPVPVMVPPSPMIAPVGFWIVGMV